jgi:hypothetical protein
MVRDAAKIMTDHPIADFADFALFSMLTSSPLAAGLGFPHYYNCQKAIFSRRRRHFHYSYTFSISIMAAYCIKFVAELVYSISYNFYKS